MSFISKETNSETLNLFRKYTIIQASFGLAFFSLKAKVKNKIKDLKVKLKQFVIYLFLHFQLKSYFLAKSCLVKHVYKKL